MTPGKHELVDSAEAYKTVIVKKSDFAHVRKEPAHFMSLLKKHRGKGVKTK